MPDLATRALRAVHDYEQWYQEVERLTAAIRECVCPNESVTEDGFVFFGGSHFDLAKARLGASIGPDGRPVSLAAIAEEVRDCGPCSRLCELIAERKVAKQRRGVAKRRVRHVGKMARLEEGEAPS